MSNKKRPDKVDLANAAVNYVKSANKYLKAYDDFCADKTTPPKKKERKSHEQIR